VSWATIAHHKRADLFCGCFAVGFRALFRTLALLFLLVPAVRSKEGMTGLIDAVFGLVRRASGSLIDFPVIAVVQQYRHH
jgi:hypothetical protein